MHISREKFETLVFDLAEDVLNQLPPELRVEAEMVMLEVAERPPSGDAGLLGLYEGVPLVERGPDDVLLQPDRITLFYIPFLAACRDEAELRREVRVTLVHELGHFFGFDEEELRQRGWE